MIRQFSRLNRLLTAGMIATTALIMAGSLFTPTRGVAQNATPTVTPTGVNAGTPSPTQTTTADDSALTAKTGTLTQLARFYPSDTLMFASMRTDTDGQMSIADLYNLLRNTINDASAPGTVNLPEASVVADQIVLGTNPEDSSPSFARDVAPWLGDNATIGAFRLPFDPNNYSYYGQPIGVLLTFDVRDNAAAKTALEALVARNTGLTLNERANGDVVVEGTNRVIVLRDDVLLIGTPSAIPIALGRQYTLDTTLRFREALLKLPAESYGIIGYIDTPALLLLESAYSYARDLTNFSTYTLIRALGVMSLGATVLPDGSLAIDVVQGIGNTYALEQFGLQTGGGRPVNAALLSDVPSDAVAVVHGADLGHSLDLLKRNAAAIGNTTFLQNANATVGTDTVENFQRILNGLGSAYTGLDYTNDVAPWLNSDYLLWVGTNPEYDARAGFNRSPFGIGLMFDLEQPLLTDAMVELSRELRITSDLFGNRQINISVETISGSPAIRFTQGTGDPATDVYLTSTDTRLILGNRFVIQSALAGDKATWTTRAADVSFATAGLNLYLNPNLGEPYLISALYVLGLYNESALPQITAVTGLFDVAAISVNATDQGDLQIRFALARSNAVQ